MADTLTQIAIYKRKLHDISEDYNVKCIQIDNIQHQIQKILHNMAKHRLTIRPASLEPQQTEEEVSIVKTSTSILSDKATMIVPPHAIAFTIRILLNEYPATCLVDTGTIGSNFVSPHFLSVHQLMTHKLPSKVALHK